MLRSPGGDYAAAHFNWSDEWRADLAALRESADDVKLAQRIGDHMRRSLLASRWSQLEAEIVQATRRQQLVELTIRSAAAELYLLPWELLTIKASNQHIGELTNVLIRYAWPEVTAVGPSDAPSRVLLAWSAAGDSVPSVSHAQALTDACTDGSIAVETLAHVSTGQLRTALADARAEDEPISALHILCHGRQHNGAFELVWNRAGGQSSLTAHISAAQLRQLFAPHAADLHLVTLCACDSSNAGTPDNHLGSLVQTLHRIGIPWVVGSRYPLSKRGSLAFTQVLYRELFANGASVPAAFRAARTHLLTVDGVGRRDWMSVQLYGSAVEQSPQGSTLTDSPVDQPRYVNELVSELVDRLGEQRKASPSDAQRKALSERIDWLVSTIKRSFAPREGSVVAGGVLRRVVGSGNFGTIWEAQDRATGEQIAVKVFRLERLSEGQMLSRFRRSIRAMRRLSEKKRLSKRDDTRGHIVRYRAEDPSGLAFAMDYLSQGNLEHLGQQAWTVEDKLEVMLSVCSAVHYAHRNGVIHRDIKPANIVLDDDRQPVLTDFDIADIKWATSLSTTVEGGLGTPVFAAPEQLVDAEQATEASDVYSLGRLLYFLLLERSPGYEVEKDPSLGNLSDHRPALVEIVRKATQYRPQQRHGSVVEMMAELERCHTGAAAARARLSRVWRWVRVNRAVLTIAALVVGGAVGFGLYQADVAKEQRAERERAERAEQRAKESAKEQRTARERAERAEKQLSEAVKTISSLGAQVTDARRRATDIDIKIQRRERALELARRKGNKAEIAEQETMLRDLKAKRDQIDEELKQFEKKLQAAQRRADSAASAAKDATTVQDAGMPDVGMDAGVATSSGLELTPSGLEFAQGAFKFEPGIYDAAIYINNERLALSARGAIHKPRGEYHVVAVRGASVVVRACEGDWWGNDDRGSQAARIRGDRQELRHRGANGLGRERCRDGVRGAERRRVHDGQSSG